VTLVALKALVMSSVTSVASKALVMSILTLVESKALVTMKMLVMMVLMLVA